MKIELDHQDVHCVLRALQFAAQDCAKIAQGSQNANLVAMFRASHDQYVRIAQILKEQL